MIYQSVNPCIESQSKTETIMDVTDTDLEKLLIGHKIVDIVEEDKIIILDNGTQLTFEDAEECCAWFEAELKKGNFADNMVTAVKYEQLESEEYPDRFTLHVLAVNENICDVDIYGNSTSGQYCQSVSLIVKRYQ